MWGGCVSAASNTSWPATVCRVADDMVLCARYRGPSSQRAPTLPRPRLLPALDDDAQAPVCGRGVHQEGRSPQRAETDL